MKIIVSLLSLIMVTVCFGQTDSIVLQLTDGTTYSYRISEIKELSISGLPSDIKEELLVESVFKTFTLYQNYPNPFNPSTNIRYEIPHSGPVEVAIYDISGRLVQSFGNMVQQAGYHSLVWNGKDNSGVPVSSGRYFCRVSFNNNILTNKLLLIK